MINEKIMQIAENKGRPNRQKKLNMLRTLAEKIRITEGLDVVTLHISVYIDYCMEPDTGILKEVSEWRYVILPCEPCKPDGINMDHLSPVRITEPEIFRLYVEAFKNTGSSVYMDERVEMNNEQQIPI